MIDVREDEFDTRMLGCRVRKVWVRAETTPEQLLAVCRHEEVIGLIEVPTGRLAVRLGPALVLALQDASRPVPDADEPCEPPPGHRAVALEPRPAVDDGLGPAVDHLVDGLVVADKEAALDDVPLEGRRHERRFDLARLPPSPVAYDDARDRPRPALRGAS